MRARHRSSERARYVRFERVFEEHSRAIFAYAARRDAQRADDVVSETFAVAWRKLDELPVDERPWLYGIARRVLAGQWRSQTRQLALVSRLVETTLAQRWRGDDETEHADLYDALGQLSESDREILLLIYWEGLEPERAAAVLEISRDALSQRLHRARERLRALCHEGKAAS
jgi:RNA polymerase sigma-70 factor (ECF subfamily)